MSSHNKAAVWLLLGSLAMPLTGPQALALSPAPSSIRPADSAAELLARGGGRSGGGARAGGGGSRARAGGGGGGRAGGGQRAQSGFQGAGGGFNRGTAKPSGGWSSKVGSDKARPSLDRPAAPRDGTRTPNRDLDRTGNRDGNRDINRDINRDRNRDVNRDINRNVNRDWNRTVNIDNLNLYPGWARAGWGVARPWRHGWYGGWTTPAWGWWGARAAAWGITSLATAAIINDAVDDAIDDHVSYIVVPNSSYQLLYGTVAPVGSSAVSFAVTADGSTYQLTADCNAGTLNGRDPETAAEAELVNAACQVAYGST